MDHSQAVVGNKYKITGGPRGVYGQIVTLEDIGICEQGGDFNDGYGNLIYKMFENVEPFISPAAELGYKVGDLFTVNGDSGVMRLDDDDNTSSPYFRDENGSLRCFDLQKVTPYKKTPAAEMGYSVGDKFIVTGGSTFKVGDIVTFSNDDGTDCPYFKNSSGKESAKMLQWVKPYTGQQLTPVVTPASKLGYKVGDKFEIVTGQGNVGEVITLTEDDGSSVPYFTRDSDSGRMCKDLRYIKPYAAPVAEVPAERIVIATTFAKQGNDWVVATNVDLTFDTRQAIRAIIDQQATN